MKDVPQSSVRLNVWSGGGAKLENPVLIDPMSGEITAPPKASRFGGTTAVDGLPLRDYPMLVLDRALLT